MTGSKTLFLMHGLPGSGKSFRASQMKSEGAHVFSNDSLLTTENGVYFWDESRAILAHQKNQSLVAKAMRQGLTPIVLDNTNIKPYHVTPYVRLGKFYKYEYTLIEIDTPWALDVDELVKRNIHGVSKLVLEKMKKDYINISTDAFKAILQWEMPFDPEVCLRDAQKFMEQDDLTKADECLIDYYDWRRVGGYAPVGGNEVAESIGNKLQEWHSSHMMI